MNLALSAIILIILLLPGAVAIRAYYTSVIEKESSIAIPFNDLLIKGIVISIILHATSVCIIHLFKFEITLDFLYYIISGKEITISDKVFSEYFLQFIWYNISILFIAWFIAKFFKLLVRKFNLDLNWFSLVNTNYWFYVFSARYLDSKGVQGTEAGTDLIVLDILTNTNIIYSGILLDFNYSSIKDELENIILDSTYKRSFEKKDEDENPQHSTGIPILIPGDAFVIPMSTIINININYISISDLPNSANNQNIAV